MYHLSETHPAAASCKPMGPEDGCIGSALDLWALVEAIRGTSGLGLNLDPTRTLNVGGGTQADIGRLSPTARPLAAAYLASFSPSLLNVPPAPPEEYFHDSFNHEYVYRGQAVTAAVPGALAIQAALEQLEWLEMVGDPLGFAAHLTWEPLTQTWMLQTNVAQMEPALLSLTQPGLGYPIYPHRFLANPTFFLPSSPPLETAIGIAAQSQIADFFTTGRISNPNQYFTGQFARANLFEIPFPLPDMLNFLQIAP